MEFTRVSPESVGVPSKAVTNLLDELERKGIEMHSFMLLRHGKVYAQGWWEPYGPDIPHIMFSFSKSFTSTAIGFAEQEGLLSLDEKLVHIFPEYLPVTVSENLSKCTIAHLLMMGCGHETEIPNLGADFENWIAAFLAQPFVFEPGTKFMYNTAGTNMLAAILKKKTGVGLTEFLKPRLFTPLGMTDIKCVVLPDGTEAGGFGLKMTTCDMARFIQFVADKGKWQGEQLLQRDWFDRATAFQISNATGDPAQDKDWASGYGYQFWRCSPPDVFRGDGAFGQFGIVFENLDAAVVITSASLDLQGVLDCVWEQLLPEMQENSLPENETEHQALLYRTQNLKLAAMTSMRLKTAEESLNQVVCIPKKETVALTNLVGGAGRFDWEEGYIQSLSFRFEPDGTGYLLCKQNNATYEVDLGINGKFALTTIGDAVYAANSRWRSQNKLEAEIRQISTVSGKRFIFRFEKDKMVLSIDSTLPVFGGLNDPHFPDLEFTYQDDATVKTMTTMYWEQE